MKESIDNSLAKLNNVDQKTENGDAKPQTCASCGDGLDGAYEITGACNHQLCKNVSQNISCFSQCQCVEAIEEFEEGKNKCPECEETVVIKAASASRRTKITFSPETLEHFANSVKLNALVEDLKRVERVSHFFVCLTV